MLCLNCGKKLRPLITRRGMTMMENKLKGLIEHHPGAANMWRTELAELPARYQRDKDRYGYDGNGFFCRGMCAQYFAELVARSGVRLPPAQVERMRAWREQLRAHRGAN